LARSCCGLAPRPVHGPGRDDLEVFDGPGDFLDVGGEVSCLAAAEQRGVSDGRRTKAFDQLKAPDKITGPTALGPYDSR
jgi:hypothetical protein